MELRGDDLFVSVTLPNILVGSVGGGTGLPSQAAALNLMGLQGRRQGARRSPRSRRALCLAARSRSSARSRRAISPAPMPSWRGTADEPRRRRASRQLGLAARLWIYQAERFPLGKHGAAASPCSRRPASASRRISPAAPCRPGRPSLVAFLVRCSFFFQLRACDEHKDAEDDASYRPERPVPRGLVSLRLIVAASPASPRAGRRSRVTACSMPAAAAARAGLGVDGADDEGVLRARTG